MSKHGYVKALTYGLHNDEGSVWEESSDPTTLLHGYSLQRRESIRVGGFYNQDTKP